MTRLTKTFERTRQEKRAALIGYITAGDPDLERSFEIIDAACGAGLDVLELGVPFSDPTADGPVIQRASNRAIRAGMTLEKGLELVKRLRQKQKLPIILFSYYNPIFAMGTERFVRAASNAGADGMLVVDLPSENADEIMRYVQKPKELHFIRLVAPTTALVRRNEILRQADGFVYIVSRRGVTGGGSNNKIDWNSLGREISEMRQETSAPLCIGFGISSLEDVCAAGNIADGVIIGSAFQRRVEENPDTAKQTVAEYVRQLRNL
ncbi:MAG: tryptophan synthase subunit alpha [Planctomycetaceae bacterium]|jgi:tryptophan synthase alpha chain|nr:tryptophan synthase subunit alpha [Planctomycetaceae bacterium]